MLVGELNDTESVPRCCNLVGVRLWADLVGNLFANGVQEDLVGVQGGRCPVEVRGVGQESAGDAIFEFATLVQDGFTSKLRRCSCSIRDQHVRILFRRVEVLGLLVGCWAVGAILGRWWTVVATSSYSLRRCPCDILGEIPVTALQSFARGTGKWRLAPNCEPTQIIIKHMYTRPTASRRSGMSHVLRHELGWRPFVTMLSIAPR